MENNPVRKEAKNSRWLLSYGRPALRWEESLPLGNGYSGAMLYGGVPKERIQFNEDTLWSGHPADYQNPSAGKVLAELRSLLFEGRRDKAEELAMRRFMGSPLRQCAFQPFGDILLDFEGHMPERDYRRWLDLDSATAGTEYVSGETKHKREMFASYPDRVLVIGLSADKRRSVSFKVMLTSPHKDARMSAGGPDVLFLKGSVSPRGEYPGSSVFFTAGLCIRLEGGGIEISDGGAVIIEADRAEIILAAATSFINYSNVSGDPLEKCRRILENAGKFSYGSLKSRHQKDYKALFRRVDIKLGRSQYSKKDTDKRIADFGKKKDSGLAALYFQFGRYLLISSSRPGSQPANLQGIWNASLRPPWGGKYTLNINTQMNYWPAEPANLSECHEPLFDLVSDVSKSGERTARNFYLSRGWVLHHNTDIWRGTAPANSSDHGIWPVGGAWLCLHLWMRHEYAPDINFLRRKAYPLMKKAAGFFLDYLVEDPNRPGCLISGPSNSPEHGGLVMGPAMDHQIIRSLFRSCICAAEVLGVDAGFIRLLRDALGRIPMDRTGKFGQLQEWFEDKDEPDDKHRHLSHLWDVFPGDGITEKNSPELYRAARKSLELRGEGGTGWSLAWKMNLWARFRDGEKAYSFLCRQLCPEMTLPNLFSLHPPFQIDGNFGAVSGIIEMLVQSHEGCIELLPALPSAWPSGRARGLRARGGFEVDIEWQEGNLKSAKVKNLYGAECRLRWKGSELKRDIPPGKSFCVCLSDFQYAACAGHKSKPG